MILPVVARWAIFGAATLSSVFAQAPANDNFADAFDLTSETLPALSISTTVGATPEAGEPNHTAALGFGNIAANSVWWRWTAPADGEVTILLDGEGETEIDFEAVLAVYSGPSKDATFADITSVIDVDSLIGVSENSGFVATAGTTYYIAGQGFSTDGATDTAAVVALALDLNLGNAPVNDDFANATDIPSIPAFFSGTTANATVEASEPDHTFNEFGSIASNSAWYRWTPTTEQTLAATITAASYDQVVAAYRGETLTDLVEVDASDDFINGRERITIRGIPGETYTIAIDGSSPDGTVINSGLFTLDIQVVPSPANDNFDSRLALDPTVPSAAFGTTLASSAEPNEPPHDASGFNVPSDSTWWNWTSPFTGSVALSVQGSNFDAVLAAYEAFDPENENPAIDELFLLNSLDAGSRGVRESFRLNVVEGNTYIFAVDAFSADANPARFPGDYEIRVDPLPTNDDFSDALDLGTTAPITVNSTNIGASFEDDEPSHAFSESGNLASTSVWFTWEPPTTGLFTASVENPEINAVLAIYTGDTLPDLTSVAAVDDSPFSFAGETLQFWAVAGTRYSIAVDSFQDGLTEGAGGFFDLSIAVVPPPVNDNFADAIFFDTASFSTMGTTIGATPEAGEPDHTAALGFGAIAADSIWYRWTAPETATAQITVTGVSDAPFFHDSIFAIYTGTELDNLESVADVDREAGASESATVGVTAGRTYHIAIQSFASATVLPTPSPISLDVVSDPSTPPSAFNAWIAGFPELTGDDALPDANPSDDGISNLLKLVYDLDPRLPITQDPSAANAPSFETVDGTPTLSLNVSNNLGLGTGSIRPTVESSQDLLTFTPVGTLAAGPAAISVAPQPGRPRSFTRIRAEIVE